MNKDELRGTRGRAKGKLKEMAGDRIRVEGRGFAAGAWATTGFAAFEQTAVKRRTLRWLALQR